MDTGRLKRFATEARTILMQGVKNRLQALGFDLKTGEVQEIPQEMDGGAVFMNDVVSTDFYNRWMSLYKNVKARNIREVAEEAAYTWFNRFMAIRIMEKRGFISPILEYESDEIHVPIIVNEATQGRLPQMTENVRTQLMELLDDPSKTSEQFALLIVAYCHDNPIINKCFGAIADYTELLLPVNILSEGGFIDMVNHTEFITEEQYASAELIGWLYQFYISDRKDEAFAKKGKYDPDEIAPATQIFTPNWIVKYMVQNTIGRIYLDNNPYEDELKEKWTYLVEPSEKTPQESIFHYDDLKELKTADLASGSGHILNEAFDLFYDLYINEGYSRKDAIENIFRYNLLGLDIDSRAKQLATFALLMKACQRDQSFLDGHLMPKIYSMPRPIKEVLPDYVTALPNFLLGANQKMMEELTDALQLMNHADTLGSIMKFDLSESTRNTVMIRVEEYEEQLTQGEIVAEENRMLLPYMHIILALTEKYAAICMNPPYMGSDRFDNYLKNYVLTNYPSAKPDLFSVFILVANALLMNKGKLSMITMHGWLFLSSFISLRTHLLEHLSIDSLLHLGPHTFDELGGEVVQSVAYTLTNTSPANNTSIFFRLVDDRNCEEKNLHFLNNDSDSIYVHKQSYFNSIPGHTMSYWVNDSFVSLYSSSANIGSQVDCFQGMIPGDVRKYLRKWYEISQNSMLINEEQFDKNKIWVPYTKGGSFKRWYGNNEYVVYWVDNGNYMIRNRSTNSQYYLKPCLTWSGIGTNKFALRYCPQGFLWDATGSIAFPKYGNYNYLLGLMNSVVANEYIKIINPTIHTYIEDVISIPYIENTDSSFISEIVELNLAISKSDWDAHETSWDFAVNELVLSANNSLNTPMECVFIDKNGQMGSYSSDAKPSFYLESLYNDNVTKWTDKLIDLQSNEEKLNKQFIELYGLQDELTPEVPLDEVSILQQGEISINNNNIEWHPDVVIKQLISYAVGCMMGRYSIDKPGLILANQGDGIEQYKELVPNSRFEADDDGIVPLMSARSDFADNATVRFKQWLSITFGELTLVENLNFIEKSLGKSIDDYFVKDFWKDHKKTYENRPIYWLFSSKKGAFQCLAYMHRMDAYTAERIRTKYLLPHIEWLIQKQNEMETNAANLNSQERKQLDNIVKQIEECREYHDRLHVVADEQIGFDLDDGVVVNYAKFGEVLAKIK